MAFSPVRNFLADSAIIMHACGIVVITPIERQQLRDKMTQVGVTATSVGQKSGHSIMA